MKEDESQKKSDSNLTYVDRQDISEIFADSVSKVYINNNMLRIEYIANRINDIKNGSQPSGHAVVVCRIVMPVNSIIDISAKLQDLISKLRASGVIRHIHNPENSEPIRPN